MELFFTEWWHSGFTEWRHWVIVFLLALLVVWSFFMLWIPVGIFMIDMNLRQISLAVYRMEKKFNKKD